ncbi:putative lipase [Aspergillus brunneoviolaceus CBS 621.78]|uniref:Lipase n=1 Tax=Aspergillus brunneoviolaceus CBS 621.78 TaxID=1450534 RepID=A0ACD1FUQ4_9EURO|nr:lipase [Aspergillus brunneoviolaceus CBS 621.78]RAH40697.1 lipase [Aspergillus brunneoviolaceus CBS 621.78]
MAKHPSFPSLFIDSAQEKTPSVGTLRPTAPGNGGEKDEGISHMDWIYTSCTLPCRMAAGFLIGIFVGVLSSCPTLLANCSLESTPAPTLLSILTNATHEPGVNGRVSDLARAIQARLAGSIAPPITGNDSLPLVWKIIEKIFASGRQFTLVDLALKIVTSELLSQDILMELNQYQTSRLNLLHNRNPMLAYQPLYPRKAAQDVPYSVAEETLRAAIYIQDDLTRRKGELKPVLLVPGSPIPAGSMFQSNLAKLQKAIPEVSMAWVNVPSASLGDVQVNSEYIAYAINYITALSESNLTVIAWSQGGLNTQWAFKYWPSTRAVVTDLIAISPDFHGTVETTLVCPILSNVVCTPAIWQQAWHAGFVRALRRVGGDSAYVPTTTVYSSYDQIVQPMSGKQASGILQFPGSRCTICRDRPGGGLYTHEGVLYSSLAWALIADALQHDGPGDPSRLNLTNVCGQWLPPQLGMEDVKRTEGLLLIAVAEVLKYKPKIFQEPEVADYAW